MSGQQERESTQSLLDRHQEVSEKWKQALRDEVVAHIAAAILQNELEGIERQLRECGVEPGGDDE